MPIPPSSSPSPVAPANKPIPPAGVIIHDDASANATSRHWSDIVGCVAFFAIAAWDVWIAPAVSLALVPVFGYEIASGLAFLTRRRARATVRGWRPRMAAYGATFIVPVFLAFAASREPGWLTSVTRSFPAVAGWAVPAGNVLIVAGAFLSAWGLWYLRHSISVEPAARGLVTRGPYAIVRHPLYLAYLLSYSGIVLQRPTVPVAVMFIAWFGMAWARIRYEEHILVTVFPKYLSYRARVGMLWPKFSRAVEPS